ncbi:MAG: serine protease, partial [Planktomarina sp.]|nr:serine protease [Planktomarina sp.]
MQRAIHHLAIFIFLVWGHSAIGQLAPDQYVWIQVEARPDLKSAMNRIKVYRTKISNVVGFEIEGGWFGITLGPYKSHIADALLAEFKEKGLIPPDSFVARRVTYGSQFYTPRTSSPQLIAEQSLNQAEIETTTQVVTEIAIATKTATELELSDAEKLEITKISENALTFDEKKYLQRALAWANHYQGAIDGLYGPETRQAMLDWQIKNRYPHTGFMAPAERSLLLNKYTSVISKLNLVQISNLRAGITLLVPRGILGPAKYEAPFVRFEATDNSNTQIILISQAGDATRLKALFEVIQTLDIVPKGGILNLGEAGFSIETSNNELFTTGFAKLIDGKIKGAILVWPSEDEARRLRLKAQIFDSFGSLGGVLPEAEFFETGLLPKDLISGLKIRQPIFARSGVFLNAEGVVLTANRDLELCGSIELGFGTQAKVKAFNSHLAVLTPMEKISPPGITSFQLGPLKAPRRITAGGYSFGGSLGAPTLTRGLLQELGDLSGNDKISRLQIDTLPGDAGGPIYDSGGNVIGILLPKSAETERQLPNNVNFSANWNLISSLLNEANISISLTEDKPHPDLISLSDAAKNTIALITCWE